MTTSQLTDVTASAWLRGVQDLTVTVPDLAEASQFFESFFGAVVVSESGPDVNADVRAEIRVSRMLRTPFLNLRLVEASYPGQRTLWPGMLDVGGWHLAGYVDDIDAALEFLESHEVYILGPGKKPTTNGPEVGEGSYACHCMTSWGFHFELLTYPNGRAYMADFDSRLWNPAAPDAGATLREPAGPAMPGFRGFEHLSIAVADIEEASTFFENVLGCERFYDMGPVSDPHGSGFGAYANVDVRVKVSKVRLFRTPYLNVELIEPRFPGQNRSWPGRFDIGGWHLTVVVADLDAALERTASVTPFGLSFDLVESTPTDTDHPASAWHPAVPGR